MRPREVIGKEPPFTIRLFVFDPRAVATDESDASKVENLCSTVDVQREAVNFAPFSELRLNCSPISASPFRCHGRPCQFCR